MPRKRKGDPVHGWVNLDKPYGLGSTSAVGKLRWLFNAAKAGHAGTLDPLASGVLPIALGEATKTVAFMQDAIKGYDFTIAWGENTSTWDVEGEVTQVSDVRPIRGQIEAVLPDFTGDISQIPPKFSAIKVDGKRAYDLARGGEDITLAARSVYVEALTLTDCTDDSASFSVICGKGTYVRSLARDISAALGTCGHVTHLRRTRVGPFTLDNAVSLEALIKTLEPAREAYKQAQAEATEKGLAMPAQSCHRSGVLGMLRPVKTALDDIPVLAITDTDATELKHGRAIALPATLDGSQPWVLCTENGVEIALCSPRDGTLYPKRVFNL
ncbi:tRNA pseudouridine(55) synthase TruB [Fretibacter rubidus]|uniref:tRNA pseudouridine(55) synthase TruB n=1 Tax=Fretibacter rubidus TaxID=570162 RepID=UPI00352B4544